ncbi:hypothetical protein DFH06DRAFT_1201333 [Mycena polygramma]|nr:hypothetical protein DFH06DRAFT_1201333 [Mycena polygramma]
MPLVLHESSSCDVCLDGYSFLSLDEAPHAIPCGHIFCRACLLSVEPTNCPLCRKAFNRERIKKLHVDRPEADPERDLLGRLALAFDAAEADQARISEELTAWLEGRPEDDHVALRKAWAALKAFHHLTERRRHDKATIKHYERQIRQLNEEGDLNRDTQRAVESSLLTQVATLTACIADLEAQVNPLRNELSRYQHANPVHSRANPLPAPPEPIPLERFPPFARATAESKEGYAAYFTPGAVDPPAATGADRKGKGKQPPYSMYNPTGNVIIPGATPSQRVIPGEDTTAHAYHTHAPASAYVDGYASGYGEGYGAANAGMAPDGNHASTSAYRLPPREPEDSLEDAIGSLRLYGAAIAPVVSRPPESAPPTMPRRQSAYPAAPSHASTADDTSISSQADTYYTRPSAFRRSTVQIDGHLPNGQWNQPSIYAPPAPPMHTEPTVHFDTQAQDENPPPTHQTTAWRAIERNRINRQSYSSWGTVYSNANASPTGTRGSMGEITGLATFPLVPSRRNSTSSTDPVLDRGLVTTPRPDDGRVPLGFVDAAPMRPAHVHSYSLPSDSLPTLNNAETQAAYDASSLQRSTRVNNRQRTVPRRFSQLPTGASEFGVAEGHMLPVEPPPIENALGLELGREAAPTPRITAPTPRVQMQHFIHTWS